MLAIEMMCINRIPSYREAFRFPIQNKQITLTRREKQTFDPQITLLPTLSRLIVK